MKLPLIRTASKHGQQLMRFTATEETGGKPGAGFLLGCPSYLCLAEDEIRPSESIQTMAGKTGSRGAGGVSPGGR